MGWLRSALLCLILWLPAVHAADPAITPTPCPGEVEDGVSCGVFTVTATAGGKTTSIPLPYIDIAGRADQPPLILLAGGPGTAIEFARADTVRDWAERAKGLAHGRRALMLSQRGTAFPVRPVMDCAELGAMSLRLGGPEKDPERRALIAMCAERVKTSAFDPAMFSTAMVTADHIAFRKALGVERWIPLGFSYGTRLALWLAATDADAVAALVLDGADPPFETRTFRRMDNFAASLRALGTDCAAIAGCGLDGDQLVLRAGAAADALTARPKTLRLPGSEGTGRLQTELDGADFLSLINEAAADVTTAEWLPRVIDAAARRKYKPLSQLASILFARPSNEVWGVSFSVDCQDFDELTLRTLKGSIAPENQALAAYKAKRELYPEGFCRHWFGRAPEIATPPPLQPQIPLLILAGRLDPVTPPASSESLAKAWGSRATLITYPRTGHVVTSQTRCALGDIGRFLEGTLQGNQPCGGDGSAILPLQFLPLR